MYHFFVVFARLIKNFLKSQTYHFRSPSNSATAIAKYCTTELYTKPNGARACGILLPGLYNNSQGVTECGKIGARLPEAASYEDSLVLNNLMV